MRQAKSYVNNTYGYPRPQDLMSDRNSTESRMVIRRNRASPMSTRLNSIPSASERTQSYSGIRKKLSAPARPYDTTSMDFDMEDIERRRRRIRSINNIIPPLPVSSKYRGYLPSRSTETLSTTTTTSSSHPGTRRASEQNSTFYRISIDIDDDNVNSDNEKSSYSSISERRTLWRGSKSEKVLNDLKTDKASPKHAKKTAHDKRQEVYDDRTVGETKSTDHAGVQIEEPKAEQHERNMESEIDSNNKHDTSTASTRSPQKNLLSLTVNVSDRSDLEDSDMESSGGFKGKRSASMKMPKSAPPLERKSSQPSPMRKSSFDVHDPLPDLDDTQKQPNNSTVRLKRDYHLTDTEITALRYILKKADMYDQTVRERMFRVLKIEQEEADQNLDEVVSKVVSDKEIESLKQRLFMSRKELDSYISFTKKMEREKRQFQSEKEELETKIQWHERRLARFETENKSLKTERANMMNQIYELRSKTTSIKDGALNRQKTMDASMALTEQSKLESSKQRFIHEADVFAQERTKLIKERQRLDEDNRKAHIRNVSLIAQVQHWEKTVKELEIEKDELKMKLSKMSKQSIDDQRKLLSSDSSKDVTDSGLDVSNKDRDYNCLIETIKFDDSEITRLRKELEELEEKCENLKNDNRNIEENQITIDHENMALKDTVNVLQNAKDEADGRMNEVDKKYHETTTELKTVTLSLEELEKENIHLQKELEHVSSSLNELQCEAVEMESDQDSFKKFLDKLSMELQEKLGEEHVSKDTEAESLQEHAEIIGRQVVAHLNPSRKLQEDYEVIKSDKEDLEEEIKFLKFALSNRMEIKTLQAPAQKCECSKEKAALKRDYEDALNRLETLEDEVTRLHQDKQQLLMSFLNLQASTRSRDVSKSGLMTDDDLSDDGETETERESDCDTDIASRSMTTSSNAGSLSDIKIEDDEDKLPVRPLPQNSDDLRSKLDEALKTIQRLESDRIEMLDSLCQQADNNNLLKNELEDLKNTNDRPASRPGSRAGSRPSSGIPKTDSMISISSEKCVNCTSSGDEIRSYLSIIEELTEDKLRLEKSINDLELEKDKYEIDLEKMTENYCKMENEMVIVDNEKESTVRSAKEETKLLLRNVQSLREENTLLEENLHQMDEDRREVLQNLKQAEEDRLGFIRTLQLISEQKESVEERLEQLQVDNEDLNTRLRELEGPVSTLTPLDLSKGAEAAESIKQVDGTDIEVDNDTKGENHDDECRKSTSNHRMSRSRSTPASLRCSEERTLSTSLQSPREFPMRRTNSIEDITEFDESVDISELAEQMSSLKQEVNSYKTLNQELSKSLDYANKLLREEKKCNLRLLSERNLSPASTPLGNENRTLLESPIQEELIAVLETISELPSNEFENKDGSPDVPYVVPERRRSQDSNRSFEGQSSDETRPRRPTMERRNSITDDEILKRRNLYGQRKSSMSLDEMYDLFGVQNSLQSSSSTSLNKDSSPTSSKKGAKTLSFEVSKNGLPLYSQEEF